MQTERRVPTGLLRVAALALLLTTALALPAAAQDASTEYRIQVGQDGDAEWEISNVVPLATDAERLAFRELANDPSALDRRADDVSTQFSAIAQRASERTGRDMEVRDVSVDASVRDGEGVVTVSFTWTGFVETRNGEERAGDVFDGGLPLGEGDTFTLTVPSGTTFDDVPPGATVDGNTLTIEGPGTALVGSVELVPAEEGAAPTPGMTALLAVTGVAMAALLVRRR